MQQPVSQELQNGDRFASVARMHTLLRFVYILKSVAARCQYYTGVTSNVAARLIWHHAGLSRATAKHRQWRVLVVMEFDDEEPAVALSDM